MPTHVFTLVFGPQINTFIPPALWLSKTNSSASPVMPGSLICRFSRNTMPTKLYQVSS